MSFEIRTVVQVSVAQQWYDEIDNLNFSKPQDGSSTEEESGPPGEEVQEGRVRIGCTIDTSPGTSEVYVLLNCLAGKLDSS